MESLLPLFKRHPIILCSLYDKNRRVPISNIIYRVEFIVCALCHFVIFFPVRPAHVFVYKKQFFGGTIHASIIEKSTVRNKTLKSARSEEHTSELQSRGHLVCRLLLE